jgi:hypothetical protein
MYIQARLPSRDCAPCGPAVVSVRLTRADIDKAKLLAELAARPRPTEEEIEAQAAEDGDAWTDEELADAEPVYPPPSPD